MKKLFSLLFASLLMFSLANAQGKMAVGVGGNVALPMGTFGDIAKMGFGGGANFEYEVSPGLNATASAQYLMFGVKSTGEGSYKVIPILAGAKYSFGRDLFGFVETGLNLWPSSTSSPEFGYAAGVGYSLPMGGANLDFSVKFQTYASSTSAINLGVAYKFGL